MEKEARSHHITSHHIRCFCQLLASADISALLFLFLYARTRIIPQDESRVVMDPFNAHKMGKGGALSARAAHYRVLDDRLLAATAASTGIALS